MKANKIRRNYHFTDVECIAKANNLARLMERDQTEFANYGVSLTDITDFKTEINAVEELPTDIEWLYTQAEKTEIKQALRDELQTQMREIFRIAESCFTKYSAKYRRFGDIKISVMSDVSLWWAAKKVKKAGEILLPLMAAKGLTQTMLDELQITIDDFDEAMFQKEQAVYDREDAKTERIEMHNELYKKMMDYASFGKISWLTNSEAKYNDYVLYEKKNK